MVKFNELSITKKVFSILMLSGLTLGVLFLVFGSNEEVIKIKYSDGCTEKYIDQKLVSDECIGSDQTSGTEFKNTYKLNTSNSGISYEDGQKVEIDTAHSYNGNMLVGK